MILLTPLFFTVISFEFRTIFLFMREQTIYKRSNLNVQSSFIQVKIILNQSNRMSLLKLIEIITLEENLIGRLIHFSQLMTLKKTKNPLKPSATSSSTHFRTIVKSRANKQTIRDLVQLSVTLQQNIANEDNRSVQSTMSEHKKSGFENNPTDKIKNFVRNMKMAKQTQQQAEKLKIPKNNDKRDLCLSRASVYSSRSSRSIKSNIFSMHVDNDMADNRSVISTRSMAEDGLSKSKIFFGRQASEFNKERIMDKLNKMEEKMDFLVKNRLKNLMHRARPKHRHTPKPFLGARGYSTELDQADPQDNLLKRQVQNIVNAIISLKQKDSDSPVALPELQQNISQLDKKIELLQKILASNFTEAQILRKFYFAQKSQKYPHLSTKQKIIQQISKRNQTLKGNFSMLEMRDLRNKAPIIKYESTSKYCYKKPSQGAYINNRNNARPFIANRQPLPRSSYDRQFLNYGTLPVFNYKPHDSKYTSSKLNVKTSNYQETFKQKHIELKQLNYRQLDCFKDKIKTGSISFSQMYKNKSLLCKKTAKNLGKNQQGLKENKSSIQKAIETLSNLQKLSKLSTTNSKFMGGTQMKREFVWHSHEKATQAQGLNTYGRTEAIKDGNLNNLKAAYKMEFLR